MTEIDYQKEAESVANTLRDGGSVSGYLKELVRRNNEELAREECTNCRRGDFPFFRPHGRFMHRIDKKLWWICRANAIWKRNRELTD